MRHIPNLISVSRIFLSIGLVLIVEKRLPFIIVYLICGLSDALDGYIARKTNSKSLLGARLDSIADLVMFGIIISVMVIWAGDTVGKFLPWIFIVLFIRLTNMAIAVYKYHSFAIVHTWGNKLSGFLIFAAPLIIIISESKWFAWCVFIICLLSAVEELIIHATSEKLDLNRISIFKRK